MDERYLPAYGHGFFDGQLGRYREECTQDTFQRIIPGCALTQPDRAAYRDGWIEGQRARHGGV